jgi:short-subunit dehydrogenase
MITKEPKVILVTGATAGIGQAIAEHLHHQGHKVYGTGRKTSGLTKSFNLISLDLNNTSSVNQAVDGIIMKEGRLDVLVNNAGMGLAGAIEETSEEEVTKLFDTNLLGLHRTCAAVIPHMRRQRSGKIINIGSMAGMIGLPFRGYYSASKYAVEGFSESLSMELKQFGIKVVLVQPGDMKTSINQNRVEVQSTNNSPYFTSYNYVKAKFTNAVANAYDPIVIAKIISNIINQSNPRFRYRKGNLFENFTYFVKCTVPFRWFETFVNMYYRMNKLVK